ncbi:MAG: alpha-L-fucosidase [Muribaculaceae bacterium]|nr:alpha-L-fucosidase [Muribaculaceae bacterium]
MNKRFLPVIIFLFASCVFAFANTFLFIGDSITDGNWGSPSGYPCSTDQRNQWDKNHLLGHGYVEMIAGELSGNSPEEEYEFINRGISGETLNQIAARWDNDVIAHKPDVVSLLAGTNDIHYWLENNPSSLTEFDFTHYRQELDSLIDYTHSRLPDTKIVVCTPFVAKAGYVGNSSNFELRKAGVDSIAAIIREIVIERKSGKVELVDFNILTDKLAEENPEMSYWVWDGIHPTTAMHYRMAKEWLSPSTDFIYVSEDNEKMAEGKFEPTWESLKQYEVPEWFRDAKFGIWAHWGPQCVEGSGDWMARSLYQEGSDAYKYHVEKYGHPSEVGFKDILPLFKAENWNPDSLVSLYKSVGAKYFMVLGNHHDNFDLWDSQYQHWNSKNIGAERDILAEWSEAAKKNDLPFGVSLHADHAWIWYEPAQRYDRHGEKSGVYYDGKLSKKDGKGKWWEGLDPQMLYQQDHEPSYGSWSDGMIHSQWGWENGASKPSREFVTNFYDRTLDVINRYKPDLLYFDVTVLPFYPISDAGLKIASHFYNSDMEKNEGKLEGVIFGKILDDEQKKTMVWDVERGAPNQISEIPWQTCTCIGGWHYNNSIYENNWYKSASQVVKLLADVVSKNGNLLLNIPLRGDGTFDEKEYEILLELRNWMNQNGEAIYATRPWIKFGEGPIADADIKINAQGFNEDAYTKASSSEIRFTTKGDDLYAIALGWPENGIIEIKSVSLDNFPTYNIELLGYGPVKFSQDGKGVRVKLPKEKTNQIAPVLKLMKK